MLDETEQMVEGLLSGDLDAIVLVNFHGHKYEAEGVLKQTGVVFSPTPVKFATAKGKNGYLLETIDSHLSKWKADSKSEYYAILNKWFHFGSQPTLVFTVIVDTYYIVHH